MSILGDDGAKPRFDPNRHMTQPTPPSLPALGSPEVAPRVTRRSRGRAAAPAAAREPRDYLMIALSLMTLTYVWRIQDLFPIIGKFSPALLFTGVAIALWVADGDPRRRVTLIFTPTLKLLIGILVLMLLSIPGSLWPGNSVRFMYQDFGLTFVFMLMIAASIRGIRDLEWFGLVHLAGATLYSAVVLSKGRFSADGRLAGLSYYDPNDLALVLACTLPLLVYYMRPGVKPWLRMAAAISFTILTLTIVKTGSRGGFLGLVAVMAYVLFYFRAIRKTTRIVAAVAGVLVLVVVGGETYWVRVQSILRPEEDYNWSDNNLAGRKAIWKRGIGYMAANPLLGVGVRCFGQAEGMLSAVGVQRSMRGQGFKWSTAHNSFVEIGAEVGLPALALFILAFVRSMKLLGRLRARASPRDPVSLQEGAFAQAVIGGLLTFVVAGFFLSQAYSAFLYTLFGLTIGLTKLHPELLGAPTPAPRHSRGARVTATRPPAPLPAPRSAHP
jgi:O-antigen ligase